MHRSRLALALAPLLATAAACTGLLAPEDELADMPANADRVYRGGPIVTLGPPR